MDREDNKGPEVSQRHRRLPNTISKEITERNCVHIDAYEDTSGHHQYKYIIQNIIYIEW